jgi:hypothetical protein
MTQADGGCQWRCTTLMPIVVDDHPTSLRDGELK